MVRGDIAIALVLIVGLISACLSEVETDGPPIIRVEWHIPEGFRHGVPSSLCFTICNEGGDAEGENNLWIAGHQIGLAQWTLDRGTCFLTGWKNDFRLQDEHITEGFVELRFYVKMWNDFGYDTYDEIKRVPVYEAEPEDPCEGIECEPKCVGYDYWATECVDGVCVKDHIIERDSWRCGSTGLSDSDASKPPACLSPTHPTTDTSPPSKTSFLRVASYLLVLFLSVVVLVILFVMYRGKEPEYPSEDVHTNKNQEVSKR